MTENTGPHCVGSIFLVSASDAIRDSVSLASPRSLPTLPAY